MRRSSRIASGIRGPYHHSSFPSTTAVGAMPANSGTCSSLKRYGSSGNSIASGLSSATSSSVTSG
ncbi:MAG: hypothetical protein F4Z77_10120 [Dehalococcoidia bacterium]|nr:hypothetical protein [Dehalococcoidia bacterium]MYA53522.1 hypothetical protein [Dehalococcoidia bacterium]